MSGARRAARIAPAALAAAVALLALAAPPASALSIEGWDGQNPFECQLQNVGFGTNFPNPGADPFCVEFDKRRQNVTELGIVDFLAQEPTRVAAAVAKCFYFQHDHWRGSIVQGDERTETYNWDGSYFFDKARGMGGVYVDHFTINNQSFDPTTFPGFPAEMKPYFGYGRGGVQFVNSIKADPRCPDPPLRKPSGATGQAGAGKSCLSRRGSVGRGLGGIPLGTREREVVRRLGPPQLAKRGVSRWCLKSGGALRVAYPSGDASGRAELLLTDSKRFAALGVRPGVREASARRKLRGARKLAGSDALVVERGSHRLLVGLRKGKVSYLATASSKLSLQQVKRRLRRAR